MIYLIRGLPGSGKSTYAKQLNCLHLEADMFHMVNGEYKFDVSNLSKAHHWCSSTFLKSIEDGIDDIVVSNTFTTLKEIEPYMDICKGYNRDYKIIRMTNKYGSVHNVPEEVIAKMSKRFEDIDGEEIVGE